jgi:hypothetical protein
MRRICCWLLTIALSAAAFLPRSLEAAQGKRLRLAFSALAYANPPFWIAHQHLIKPDQRLFTLPLQ